MQQPPRPAVTSVPPRSYGSLRTLAGACVVSAWLTLILSVLIGLGMLVAPTSPPGMSGLPPNFSAPGGGELGLPQNPGGGQLGPLLGVLAPGLKMFGVVSTIGGGILSFFFLAALGHGLHLMLDMEENTRITAQALAQIARRQGGN
jgi:hypothetical protein